MNTEKQIIAYEKITTQQGLDIFKKHIERELDLRYATDDVVGRLSFKAGRYEGLLEALLINDATKTLQDLYLIEVRYEVTEYSNEHEIEGIAIRVLNEVDAIKDHSLRFQGILSGKLRIASVSTGKYIMPYFLRKFLSDNPQVELEMEVSNKNKVLEGLRNNEVDFALMTVMPTDIDLYEEILMPNRLFLFGAADSVLPTSDAAGMK